MTMSVSERFDALRRGNGRSDYRVPAIVLGLGPTGLGVVRSLTAHRVPVIAVQASPRPPYSYTRLCRKILIDSPTREDQWRTLLDLPMVAERPVLFLTSDLDVQATSQHRDELSRFFRFHLPAPEDLEILMDKTAFAQFAARHGFPVPKTLLVEGGRGWDRVLDEGPFPCIVKPKYRTIAWRQADFPKGYVASSRDKLRALISTVDDVEGDYVIQEWIPGPDSNVFFHLAYHDGEGSPVATFTGRKIRQWPPLMGSTSMAEPAQSAEVQAQAQRLFDLVGFRGLGSVEFKRDPRDGSFKITEPTVGRPNLQSEVATANGVNIAFRAYCDLAQANPERTWVPERNVRWVFIERDIKSSLHYLRRNELTLRELFRSYRGPRYYAEFSSRDPLPALIRLAQILLEGLSRRFRRSSSPKVAR
jgi:D-aspartate ligase